MATSYGSSFGRAWGWKRSLGVVWSLGISLAQTIFDGGRNQAQIEFAKAGHDLATAEYRQTVLNALQEVEDGLSTGRALTASLRDLQAAEAASAKAAEIIDDRYKGGIASVLELISARQVLLDNQRQLQIVRGQQLVNAVFLIKSLGGGWQNTLPVQNSQTDIKQPDKSVK